MPKLDGIHIADRLRGRLEELREGKKVAKREIEALLSNEQVAAMNEAWAEQQALRKQKRARTKEEKVALSWKTKRTTQIEAYERAVAESDDGALETLEGLQRKAQVRQARIYMDTYFKATKEGKSKYVAKNLANNDLIRAGLQRVDGQKSQFQNDRDKEVWEMEQKIQQREPSEMTPEELEQVELLEEHKKALVRNRKKQGL